jgi:ABC-2 type transport system ATP-binding protein
MQSSDLAIDLHDVAKTYRGNVHALQGIEMKVGRGEVFGLLGPNGAGKSTLVKIMMTVIRPTRASGTLLGQPVGHKPTLRRVGYLPENHRFPKYLTGRQTLEHFGAMLGLDRAEIRKRAGELLDVVGMTAWADRKISQYSKGMLQRTGIAQALIGEPDLVVLDEPTDGVDPVGRRDIRDVLTRLRAQGKTIFLNSHLLSELEMLCTRVAILVRGQVARQGTIDELTARSQRYELELVPPPQGPAALTPTIARTLGVALAPVAGMPPQPQPPGAPPVPLPICGLLADGVWVELFGTQLTIGTAEAARVQPIIDALRREDLAIRRIMPVRQTLEDLFMEAVLNPATGAAYTPGAAQPQGGRQ